MHELIGDAAAGRNAQLDPFRVGSIGCRYLAESTAGVTSPLHVMMPVPGHFPIPCLRRRGPFDHQEELKEIANRGRVTSQVVAEMVLLVCANNLNVGAILRVQKLSTACKAVSMAETGHFTDTTSCCGATLMSVQPWPARYSWIRSTRSCGTDNISVTSSRERYWP